MSNTPWVNTTRLAPHPQRLGFLNTALSAISLAVLMAASQGQGQMDGTDPYPGIVAGCNPPATPVPLGAQWNCVRHGHLHLGRTAQHLEVVPGSHLVLPEGSGLQWGVCQPRPDAVGVALITALIQRLPGLAPGSPVRMAWGSPRSVPKTSQVLSHVFLLRVTSGQGDVAVDTSSFPGLVITQAQTWQLGTAFPFPDTSTHSTAQEAFLFFCFPRKKLAQISPSLQNPCLPVDQLSSLNLQPPSPALVLLTLFQKGLAREIIGRGVPQHHGASRAQGLAETHVPSC